MKGRFPLTLFALALAVFTVAPERLQATPGFGVTQTYRVVSSAVAIHVKTMASKLLLADVGNDREPVNILNVRVTFAPGAYSGWHTHSGPGFVIVEQGTITIEETAGCYVDVPQGSVLFEGGPERIHNALNRTDTPVVLNSYFFLPAFDPPGANSRIDAPVQHGSCE